MIYNQLSAQYDDLLYDSFLQFKDRYNSLNLPEKYFVTSYPSFGIARNEKSDFLFIGQAVNGAANGFNSYDVIEKALVEHTCAASNSYCFENNHTPLDWVNVKWSNSVFDKQMQDPHNFAFYDKYPYRAYRSFYWNLAFKLVSDYHSLVRDSWNWSKKLVCSNLYKIAPEDANPDWNERQLQEPFCFDLLRKEIEEIKPRFCIVATNLSWWKPFGDALQTIKLELPQSYTAIQSYESYGDTKIVVTIRPFGGNADRTVGQVLELIGRGNGV